MRGLTVSPLMKKMTALLAAISLSIALDALGGATEVTDEPVSPAVVQQSDLVVLQTDQIQAPAQTESEQQLAGGPAGPLRGE